MFFPDGPALLPFSAALLPAMPLAYKAALSRAETPAVPELGPAKDNDKALVAGAREVA